MTIGEMVPAAVRERLEALRARAAAAPAPEPWREPKGPRRVAPRQPRVELAEVKWELSATEKAALAREFLREEA